MKDLWLIRHAESLANIGESTSTPREIPLSENGLRQADDLAEALRVRPDLIIVSPYRRAEQTSWPVQVRFPDVPVETDLIQEFTYLSISRCRGTNIQQRKPWVQEYWKRSDPNYCDGDQAESFAEFLGRTENFIRRVRERDFEIAFVFTHEQVIKAMIWNCIQFAPAITPETMAAFQMFMSSFSISNASISYTIIGDSGEFFFGQIGHSIDSETYA